MIIALLLNFRDASRSIACIHSLLDEKINAIFVFDNSADDGLSSKQIVEKFENDPRIFVHISSFNMGFSAGVNAGLHWIEQRFGPVRVLLINNDAVLSPGSAEKLNIALDVSQEAKISYPWIQQSGVVHKPKYYQKFSGIQSDHPMYGSFSYVSGCCMLLDLARIDLPLFDEDFFMYGEDCELSWRWRHQPNAMLYVPGALVVHEGSASSGLGSMFYETRMVAAHLLLAKKMAESSIQRFFYLLLKSGFLLFRMLIRTWRFRSAVPIKAFFEGVKIFLKP